MPTEAQLTTLDSAALRKFIEGPLTEFINDLVKVRSDDGNTLAVRSVAHGYTQPDTFYLTKPLALGYMGADDTVHGNTFNSKTLSFAEALDGILQAQSDSVLPHIKDGLQKVITEFMKQQGGNLESIKASDFLEYVKVESATTIDPTKIPATT
ncbi:type VII secretion system-associated protein [Streptomyces flaveolus]|jgi:hypothetical protein|uniref:type VII secretion system-associated protein n=1 Tax=Streptomyces flaveolus TaxID=67297 RepID=UPI00166FE071|nr:type VII secretion system-associated protein [Streptomyces flaveolus]GGQ79324.1 hypothetical protein GCM10010216_46520 [Streptomyces flaveolus]